MNAEGIGALALALVLSLFLGVRWYRLQHDRATIARRLAHLLDPELDAAKPPESGQPADYVSAASVSGGDRNKRSFIESQIDNTEALLAQAGLRYNWWDLYFVSGSLILAGVGTALALAFECILGAAAGAVLASLPWIFVTVRANKRRAKFTEQLPNALDLFVSVLRSGHSIPQAVRAVADEVPAPCGSEFSEMLQRMNLGQSLPQALSHSVNRFKSFDLDLIRRATEIQSEVGGSLAELLEKTNATLRQRLKLQRQVQVLTAPSRLSAVIIFILPFVIAVSFSMINPDYMAPLTTTKLGRGLLCLAFAVQVVGYLIMRKLASFKV